ncbi:MAG: hypothetical protein FP814_06230 [Desulfobacterium sp.]|nr:hypothetical protein [Desulfobacterium sp.]
MIRQISKLHATIIMTICFILFFYVPGMAFKGDTHKAINKYIAGKNIILDGFSLHHYLQSQLSIQNGTEEYISNKQIFDLLGDGGELEDSHIVLRYLNHFLDPVSNTRSFGSV